MNEQMKKMAAYIANKVARRPVELAEDTPLVSSGLIDSFGLVDILLQLEKVTNRRIPAAKVQPKDMDTLRLMFATSERAGKPRA